jgi:two-component system cell cycle sensor histidine kinase/response regulator CckA
LGLAIVYGVVKQSGGFLQLESQLGVGSTFRILLPEAADAPSQSEKVFQFRSAPRGSETVLVVEDEDAVRDLARESLELHGYAVIEARHGEEALDILKRCSSDIDLVLTDLVMPKMGGMQLAENLHKVAPNLKVLFMTGYTDKWAEVEQFKASLLHKPFTPDILAHKVRQVLSGKEQAN